MRIILVAAAKPWHETRSLSYRMQYATYSPEDNKLRLYVGRVPRDEYERLRAQGWTSTPKQDCDFVAVWTPDRRDMCLEYADLIEDEDQGPEDRAADRAERFGEYRDKRTEEATGAADRFDAGPSAHGYQSQARADRAARRHDRIAGYACDAWSKAEYWQRRTAGVISHALYKSTPAVRMGRIKELEADLRKREKWLADYAAEYATATKIAEITDPEKLTAIAIRFFGSLSGAFFQYQHPRPDTVKNSHIRENGSSLYTLLTLEGNEYGESITGAEAMALYFAKHSEPREETEWTTHLKLRLAYENQMLEAAGGRAAFVEMEPGGWLGSRQIEKVNKSNATGRVVSVLVRDAHPSNCNHYGNPWPDGKPRVLSHTIKTERLAADVYRPPTDEERAAFAEKRKAEKAAAPKADPCPLVNPTDDDAERLISAWNEREKEKWEARKGYHEFEPAKVLRRTQAQYSAASAGTYSHTETRTLHADMQLADRSSNMYDRHRDERAKRIGKPICKVRVTPNGKGAGGWQMLALIVLTDKPQKPLPAAVWSVAKMEAPAFALSAE